MGIVGELEIHIVDTYSHSPRAQVSTTEHEFEPLFLILYHLVNKRIIFDRPIHLSALSMIDTTLRTP
jgi:hypothetical protein